jgi:hypothetical protein
MLTLCGQELVGSQCSGALLLAKLGLLEAVPACTDLTTKQWVIEAGVSVIDQPFHARGSVATAGGCLASQYLATWIILRLGSREGVATALHRVSPVGQQAEYIARAIEAVQPYLPPGLPLPPPQSEPLPPLASPFRGRARVDLPNTQRLEKQWTATGSTTGA